MPELLLCCDENLSLTESFDRDTVHKEGIWHKTSHVWLYDSEGYIYFQVRADSGKLYTSASGHVRFNETTTQAIIREAAEELGYRISKNELELIKITKWKFDTETKHDHAFAHIYLCKIPNNYTRFSINLSEVSDIVKINAKDLLNNLLYGIEYYQYNVHNNQILNKELLLMEGETSILKYGEILKIIMEKTNDANPN